MNPDHIAMMALAVEEAKKAGEKAEIPIGAVIVDAGGGILSQTHNQTITLRDPTAHAEMIAITQAAAHLASERLLETVLYTTVEPCAMCAGAMVLGRIKRLVFGAEDPKTGAAGSVMDVVNNKRLNHKISVTKGVLERESSALLRDFFALKRKRSQVKI